MQITLSGNVPYMTRNYDFGVSLHDACNSTESTVVITFSCLLFTTDSRSSECGFC